MEDFQQKHPLMIKLKKVRGSRYLEVSHHTERKDLQSQVLPVSVLRHSSVSAVGFFEWLFKEN